MLNTEKITLTYINMKDLTKTVEIERIAPKNVIDLNYFQFCCQYHAYNLALTFLHSEAIRVQYEDVSKLDGETLQDKLKTHKNNVKNVEKAQEVWSDIVTVFNNNLNSNDVDLLSVFKTDKFAKTYTSLVLDFDTEYETKSGAKGSTKAVKSPSKLYQDNKNVIKRPVLELERLVDRMFTEVVSKADKAMAFNPLIDILNNAYGIETLNGAVYKAVYKPANFKDIPVKYWTKYIEGLRASRNKIAKGVICELVPEATLLKNCFAIGLAKLGVVEIANYDTPVQRTLDMARKAVTVNKSKEEKATK